MRASANILATIGAAAWTVPVGLALSGGAVGSVFVRIEIILDFAMLVLVPLLIGLLDEPNRTGRSPRLLIVALVLWAPAAPLAVMASPYTGMVPAGLWRVVLALPYAGVCFLLALYGGLRFLARGRGPIGSFRLSETAIDAGFVYAAVSGVWLFFDRAGLRPLDFPAVIVLLTAVHFSFAGLSVPVLLGLAGRRLRACGRGCGGRQAILYPAVAVVLVLGPMLVALGISLSPPLEFAAATLFAAGTVGLAFVQIALVSAIIVNLAKSDGSRPPGRGITIVSAALLSLSSAALLWTMVLAMVFAYSEFTGRPVVVIQAMVLPHGLVNACAVFLAVLAHTLAPASSGLPPVGIPFSRLRARGRIGPDFLRRADLLARRHPAPRGLVDDLEVYRHPGLDPFRLDADVRAFYERTGEFELVVVPHWRSPFRLAGRIYKTISAYLGQMNFPLADGSERQMDSRIEAVRDERDGRENVRAWTRCYRETGRPLYVATYASYRHAGETYMNIAFPLPGANLTSVLRLEEIEELAHHAEEARRGGSGLR